MIRFFTLPLFLIFSFLVSGQFASQGTAVGDTLDDSQIGSFWNEPDCFPLKKNGGWVWYDIENDSISEEYFFTDYVQPSNGYCESFVLKNDSMWGMMSGYDEESLPFIYDSVIYINEIVLTQTDHVWSYHQRNLDGRDTLIMIDFDSLYADNGLVYFYSGGKTGLFLRSNVIVEAKYDAIHTFECGHNRYDNFQYLMTLTGSEFNLLDEQGKKLLPKNVLDLRCTEDNIFEFRRGVHPEYYSIYTDEIISPNGRDIIFYGRRGYKIYSEDKTTSELHLGDGRILRNTYDDYFILRDDFIAVRKNGKIGLTINGTELKGSIKYDQINTLNSIPSSTNYFKFFLGDSCGLMDEFGNELFDAQYANIIETYDPDRFIVLQDHLAGVVDKTGKEIIPLQYDYISFNTLSKLFVIQHNDKFGLFRNDGSKLLPIEYDRHQSNFETRSWNVVRPLHLLSKGDKLYFANSEGLIEKKPFNHYDYTGSVLKTYCENEILVYALTQAGLVEEKQSFPVFNPTLIKHKYFSNWSGLSGWSRSELEENQKAGYYGLRYYAKKGFGVEPTYRTIRPTGYGSYLGEVSFETNEIEWMDGVPMNVIRSYDDLNPGIGTITRRPMFNTEMLLPYKGTGDRRINYELDRAQSSSSNFGSVFSTLDLLETIHYGDCGGADGYFRRFFKGGKAEICSIDSADISLYDYYRYWNLADAVRLSPELMQHVLNPKYGVRFNGSRQIAMNTFDYEYYKKSIKFQIPTNLKEFEYVLPTVFFQKVHGSKSGRLRKFSLDKDLKEVYVDDFLSVSTAPCYFGELILAEAPVSRMAKIHVDYPNYFFHQDSIDLSYEAGRITRRIDSNFVRLISPLGEVIADSCVIIRYLNEDRFAVLRGNGWELIDENGASLSELKFIGVEEFINDRAEFGFADGSAILLNSNGEEVMPLPEGRTFLDDDHYIFASNPSQIMSRFSNQKDEALNGEQYKSKGFFVSKKDGKTNIRRFGGIVNVELKLTSKLKSFGTCLYYKKGKHLYSIDSNLVITKHKKVDKFRMVTPQIGWLEGKKDQLIDSDWGNICKMKKSSRFEMRDGHLIVLYNDSLERDFGTLIPIEGGSNPIIKTPEVRVISENGKYGVQQGEEMILPMNYSWLSKINDQEFLAKIESEQQLYNSSLDRIGNRPFDWFIQTTGGNFVFFYKDQVFVVSMDRSKQHFIN